MTVQKKNYKGKKGFLKVLVILLLLFMGVIIVTALKLKPEELVVKNVNLAKVRDGIYIGTADNGLVKATVSVEVNRGIIQDIKVLEHDNLLGKPAEKIVNHIINQQSLDVDAITSATYSSDTIRKAVEIALRKGE